MEYSKIVSVSGLTGLYELINTKSDGAIVRSLDDRSTKFASSRIHNFSHLESIEVYTVGDNVNLSEVFKSMEGAGGSVPELKDEAAIKKYFEKVYPEIDFDRVYVSDLKKMIKWFEVLKKNNIDIKVSEPEEETEEKIEEETEPAQEDTKSKQSSKQNKSAVTKSAKKKEERAEKKTTSSKNDKPEKAATKKRK